MIKNDNHNSLYEKLYQTAKKVEVPVKYVLDVFFVLRSGNSIDNGELIREVGVGKNALNKIKKELAYLLEPSSEKTKLKMEAVRMVEGFYSADYQMVDKLVCLDEKKLQLLAGTIEEIRKNNELTSKRELDQFSATAQTTAKRVVLMDFLADVSNKKILFLGDDDLTSLAVASLNGNCEIEVADIDDDILGVIKSESEKAGFNIATTSYDARGKLPKHLNNKFDIVFTDPPYTPLGMELFISRAVAALNKNEANSRLYLCYGNSDRAKERYLPIMKSIIDSGLMIRYVFDKFNRYWGADSIGSSSSLFICEVTAKTKSLVRGNYSKKIYTWQR